MQLILVILFEQPMVEVLGASRTTRGSLLVVEQHHIKIIEFVTISSTGNATDFGDLTDQTEEMQDHALEVINTRGCILWWSILQPIWWNTKHH